MRALAIIFLSSLLAACGTGPVTTTGGDRSQTEEAAPVNDRLYVARDHGLAVVNVATGKVERELPDGLLSPDRSVYWAVEPEAKTVVRKVEPVSGTELGRIALPGAFDLPRAYGRPLHDAISANGRYLALVATGGGSTFAVLDLKDGSVRATATLPGNFTFDAIDDLGTSMYVLEHPQPDVGRYNVRLFDIPTKTLAAQPVVDQKAAIPTAADLAKGTMGGVYHASATAGMWHFGLYTNASKGPVVHALNMTSRYASCLLELTGTTTHRAGWAIVTTPKQDRAFVVNAASGAFASLDAATLQMARREFSVQQSAEGDLRGSAVVTADGTRLYAAGGKGILVVDARTLSMKAQYLTDRQFASVMVSADGSRLYALDREGAISRIEPGTGRDLGIVARLPSAVSIVRID
jgi:hypothetical protein